MISWWITFTMYVSNPPTLYAMNRRLRCFMRNVSTSIRYGLRTPPCIHCFVIVILCCCKPTTKSPTTTLMITMLLCNVSYVQLCRFRFCLQLFIGSLGYVIGKFVTSARSLLAYFLTFLHLVIFSYLYYYSLQWILSRCFPLQVPNSCFIKWYHRTTINILMSDICIGVLYL